MADREKYCIFWNRVEKQAFSPSKDEKDQRRWLKNCLIYFLKQFELDEKKVHSAMEKFSRRCKGNPFEIKIPIPGCDVNCILELGAITPQKFSYSLDWTKETNDKPNKTIRLEYDSTGDYWQRDDKPTTLPERSHQKKILNGKKRNSQEKHKISKNECSAGDIEIIIKSKIVHPPLHLHPGIHSGIRISLNETNPFVFLYQLLFQLLVLVGEKKRDAEEIRLTKSLFDNWGKSPLSSSDLFPEN